MSEPVYYTPEIADKVCDLLINGMSLRCICQKKGFPSVRGFLNWVEKYPDLASAYARAREAQADFLAEQILIEADKSTQENAAAQRNKIDARKWLAERMGPKRWGNKQAVEHSGEIKTKIEKIEWEVVDPAEPDT